MEWNIYWRKTMSILKHLEEYSKYHKGIKGKICHRHIFILSDPHTLFSLAPIPSQYKVYASITYNTRKPTILTLSFEYDRGDRDIEPFFGTYMLRVNRNITYPHFTKTVFDVFWSLYEGAQYYYKSFEE